MAAAAHDDLIFLLRDARTGRWLRFSRPDAILEASSPEAVPRVLQQVDAALAAGRHVAGFIAYEAAPGFDAALAVRPDPDFPCAVFGVYGPPALEEPPAVADPADPLRVGRLRATASERAFAQALLQIREAIRAGDTYQVNYTYRLLGPFTDDPEALFRRLVHAQTAPYAAWVDAGRWAIASASPELFFRRDGDRLVSRPMKGTARRGRPGAVDRRAMEALMASQKERAENLMIVDMVRNDLSRIAEPGSVSVPDLFIVEAYPTVWQLTTQVEARSTVPLSAVFGALFPPASITGAPKASTMALIARLEDTPRRVYTGTVGFASPDGSAQFNVAIRTALVDRRTNRLTYGVGGGIVWDSVPDRERRETRTKARILHRPLPEYRLLETLRWSPDDGFVLLDDHLARLAASGRDLGFDVDPARVLGALQGAVRSFERRPSRIRLTVDRSGQPDVTVRRLSRARRFSRPRLCVAPAAVSSADPFLRHKTTHRAVYDGMLALCPDADDVLLWNEHGELTESCFSNLFLERDGVLLTPPARCGLLPGTLRGRLLADGRAVEAVLAPADLATGRVLLGNSVRGLYEPGPIGDARPARAREV